MDEALREAERRGDAERADALRRRAGLAAPPAGLPELLVALDEAEAEHDSAYEGGEFSPDPRGDLKLAVSRCAQAALACVKASGLERTDALLRVAEGPFDPRARGRACLLLLDLSPPEATLRRLVASPEPRVQRPAARVALEAPARRPGRLPWPGPPAWVAPAVREALRLAAPGDRGPLLDQLATADPRGSADLFAEHLADPRPRVRWSAAIGLVLTRDLRAWPTLEALLDHPGPAVVERALDGLALLDLPRAAELAAGRLRAGRVDVPPPPARYRFDPFKGVVRLLLDAADDRCWPHLVRAAQGGLGEDRGEWARQAMARCAKHGLSGPADFARPEVAALLRDLGRRRRAAEDFRAFEYDVHRELSSGARTWPGSGVEAPVTGP